MTKNKPSADPSPDRRFGMVAVGVPVGQLTKPLFGRHGFAGGALVMDWPAIVGPALAVYTLPQRIRFPTGERSGGTLHIKVASSAFAPEIVHLEPLILDRINGYFGWNAVDRLKLHHGPLPPRSRAVPPVESLGQVPPSLQSALDRVTDPDLRAVLLRLGQRINASRQE